MTLKTLSISIVLWLILSGCSQVSLTPTPILCNGYPLKTDAQPICIAVNTDTLIQTALNQQSQIFMDSVELTIQGTAYVQPSDGDLIIAVLEGSTIVGLSNSISTVYEAQQITIDENLILTDITVYDFDTLTALPLNQLHRSINVISPTPTVEVIPTQAPDCPRPDDWIEEYAVKSGDTLTTIASAIGESLIDLQTANCIDNPNNLQLGQILIVPQGAIPTLVPVETFTPSAVFFRADNESLTNGDCTTLRWDIQNIRELTLDELDVSGLPSQEVCPTITSTYTLLVNYFDDTKSEHQVTITVTQP
jgi:hypothetical protein